MADPHKQLARMPRPAFPAQLNDPATAEELIWRTLARAINDRHHGMHTPGLIALGADGFPNPRVVTLRRVEPAQRTLICHTDIRSEKVAEIERNPNVAWLCYDIRTRLQFRISATARIERDTPLADEQWGRSALSSRRCYLASNAPGTPSDTMMSNIPPHMAGRQPTLEESAPGRANFAIVVTTALRADVLELAAEGHRRVMLTFGGPARWVAV
jgi:general stress protein 26